ncbi:MAG: Flp family type IVb pilin, partial [Novosphingobium sp.]|nr:Flp family type IVb pilin [Novosphingobium sp.]
MTKFFANFLRDESGASAAEYALILAIVGTGIAAAAWALGTAISSSVGSAAACVEGAADGSA